MVFYSGKHEQNKKSGFWRRPALVVLSLAMLLLVSVGGTLAFLIDKTDSVQNTFTPSTMTIDIEEDFTDPTVKKDVQIENTGDVDAWIRATVIFNWADEDDNPVKQVESGDLNITWNNSSWFQGTDGYYYHHASVAPNGFTGILLDSVSVKSDVTLPAGADHLQVTIVSQAIQSSPEAALEATRWPVKISDGQLKAK